METTINQRVSQLIQALDKKPNAFAESIEKTPTAIYTIINGRNKPGYDILEAILLTYPQINASWLLTGTGSMFDEGVKQVVGESDTYLKEHLNSLEQNFARLASQLEVKDSLIVSLTRMLESALGKPKDTSLQSRIIPLWPVEEKAAV